MNTTMALEKEHPFFIVATQGKHRVAPMLSIHSQDRN